MQKFLYIDSKQIHICTYIHQGETWILNYWKSMATVKHVAEHLFPTHEPVTFIVDRKEFRNKYTTEELKTAAAGAKLKSNKAPGLGNMPPIVVKLLSQTISTSNVQYSGGKKKLSKNLEAI